MKNLVLLAFLLLAPLSSNEIERLVQQLDSPKLAKREAAERSLIEAGPDVLDMLPDSEAHLSAEMERRIARIRGEIEQKIARQWVKPTRITLDRPEMTLRELLESVRQQTGNRVIVAQEAAQRSIDCTKIKNNSFWGMGESVATLSPLQIRSSTEDRAIEFVPGKTAPHTLHPAGPFLLSIVPQDTARLEIKIFWEPRLKPIWLKLALKDPNGQAIGTYELNPPSEKISTRLTVPAPTGVSGLSVRGTLTGLIPAPNRTFRFPLSEAKDHQQRFAQVALQLLNVRMEGSKLRLAVRLRYTQAHDALESYRGWFFKNEAYLVNRPQQQGQDPKRLSPTEMETDNRTANSIDLIYHFKLDGKPSDYDFTYRAPIALVPVEYDFSEAKKAAPKASSQFDR